MAAATRTGKSHLANHAGRHAKTSTPNSDNPADTSTYANVTKLSGNSTSSAAANSLADMPFSEFVTIDQRSPKPELEGPSFLSFIATSLFFPGYQQWS